MRRFFALPALAVLLFVGRAGGDAPPGHYQLSPQTALDTKTGLRWQRVSSAGVPWSNALQTCSTITLDGQTGYRLPTVRELETIYDPRATSGPVWDKTTFSAANATLGAGQHWASNEDGDSAYLVYFIPTPGAYMGTMAKTDYAGGRCVKGP
jgi:hypothetical protein